MTEGERLSSIKQAHDYILQSMDLKLQSDQLVLNVMNEAEQSKAGPLQRYEHQLERQVLATTPCTFSTWQILRKPKITTEMRDE